MLSLVNVRKRFGGVQALDGCSFSVERGRMLGFLGPNGAGKTTTMRAIFGLVEPDVGEVLWDGGPIGLGENYHGRRADGTEFPAEMTILPLKRADATIVFATVIDLTYRATLRERLRKATSPAGSTGDVPEPDPPSSPSA